MPNIEDINAEARDLCDADTDSYTASSLLRRINEAYERVVGWILEADGMWQWDDTNFDDLPIGLQTLVEGQGKYSFNDKFLEMEEVQIKDVDGNWQIIRPIDQKEFSDFEPLSEAFEDDGMPEYYDKIADDTLVLYPAPTATSVTLTNGLKIKFRRTADVFTSAEVTTGTKIPGFISSAHYVLSYLASIPYCMSYKKDRVALYEKRVEEYKIEIIKSYSKRERDKRKIITTKQRAFK
jgi:hypothetical protein